MLLKQPGWTLICFVRDVGRRLVRLLDWRRGADAAKRRPAVLLLADKLGRETGRTRFLDNLLTPPPAPVRPDLSRWETYDLAACWLGHATLLLRVGGRTVLTDPVFSNRVGVGLVFATLGPKRFQRPAATLDELPPIDLILSSHAHFDHLDRPSLWRLGKRFPDVPVVCASGTRDLIDDLGFRDVRELSWGEETTTAGVRVAGQAVTHWGPRVFYDRWRGYNAYVLERGGRRVIFGGDSAMTDAFKSAGPCDLMAVGIAAYDPFVAAHATPEQAWRMTRDAGAAHVLPMHHRTFRLSREPMDEPIRRFLAIAAAEGMSDRVVARQVGDVWASK